jgi:hypothetical protein
VSLADEEVGERSGDERAHVQQGGESVKRILEIVTAVGGYTAVLSALTLYFGYLRTRTLFGYFGVPLGVLQLSTTDYLLRAPDVFFRPVAWSTLGLAMLVMLSVAVEIIDRKEARRLSLVTRGVLGLATALSILLGILGLVGKMSVSVSATSLVLGGALIVIQYRLYRRIRPPVIVPVIGLIIITAAAFWWVSVYAVEVGKRSAGSIAHSNDLLPDTIIYSKNDLQLLGREEVKPTSGQPQPWAFKFTGYKVLFYANDRWFLIRREWKPELPTVMVPDDDSVRIELLQGR